MTGFALLVGLLVRDLEMDHVWGHEDGRRPARFCWEYTVLFQCRIGMTMTSVVGSAVNTSSTICHPKHLALGSQ